jgi:hypothetical protein
MREEAQGKSWGSVFPAFCYSVEPPSLVHLVALLAIARGRFRWSYLPSLIGGSSLHAQEAPGSIELNLLAFS